MRCGVVCCVCMHTTCMKFRWLNVSIFISGGFQNWWVIASPKIKKNQHQYQHHNENAWETFSTLDLLSLHIGKKYRQQQEQQKKNSDKEMYTLETTAEVWAWMHIHKYAKVCRRKSYVVCIYVNGCMAHFWLWDNWQAIDVGDEQEHVSWNTIKLWIKGCQNWN